MADLAINFPCQKFCANFYKTHFCANGESCAFPHKGRHEIEIVDDQGNDFILGKNRTTRTGKVCRFFLRGNCMHQQNCHFKHDNATYHNGHNSNHSPSSTNTPSTSAQSDVVPPTNKKSKKHTKNHSRTVSGADTENKQPETHENIDTSFEEEGACASPPLHEWVNAPEFVPKISRKQPRSYAEALSPEALAAEKNLGANARKLCPYVNKDGICRNVTTCNYLHGEMCDLCERPVLHPFNDELKKKHRQECIQQHEKNMELSFAVARSKEKTCGVCFEVIMEKANGEQRFGILPNCNHCFCLTCIRKWRQARQFENKIIRACPECRVTSDFVCPSMYWVDTKEDKDKLIDDYKKALSRKDCKYFKKGTGKCPFGNKCFYLHAFPDGRKCDVGPPPRQRRFRGLDSDIDWLQHVMLWDFLEERDFPWQTLADELEDLVSFFTDSDDSDWSDYDLFID